MAEKPSYLKLLNGISCAETRAFRYLSAWADVTTDPDVRAVLHTVAAREGEHGMAFAKRVNELGFELQPTDDPKFAERMEIAGSDRSDLDKAEALGVLEFATAPDAPDVSTASSATTPSTSRRGSCSVVTSPKSATPSVSSRAVART